ncbi:MAG: phosphotransferase family protein, partial [Solirubrobacteraceae bacterium]
WAPEPLGACRGPAIHSRRVARYLLGPFASHWIVTSTEPWQRLVTIGPAGFAGYARVRFIPDPTHQGQQRHEADLDGLLLETNGMDRLGWLSEYSESALRSALRVADAGLDRFPIELTGTNDLSRPTWASGTATVDGRFLAKFAFSEPTAVRVWHEARVLKLLGEQPAFRVPNVVAASPDPACLATRIVGSGVPLSFELVRGSTPKRVAALGAELARFLANLHAPQILALARERLDDPLRIPDPGLQATTDALRLRFIPMIQPRQRVRVRRWCDWAHEQLAVPATIVFVHGDFHPYNQLWDAQELRLLLVADFETSGIAEPEYDFRAIPSFGPGIDLLTSTIDEYVALTGRRLSVERIMALHLRTSLGDALWRTEAGLPLLLPRPGGGTPDDYVDELAARFALLGIDN